jgi:hypothetical protein
MHSGVNSWHLGVKPSLAVARHVALRHAGGLL